jgi:hypothetical protein
VTYKRIYILTPPGVVTGGPEAIYQLCDSINSLGGNCFILFKYEHLNPFPEEYHHYNINQCYYSDDINKSDNLIIVPEIWTGSLYEDGYNNMSKAIWWLSVDNCYDRDYIQLTDDVLHLYQSEYAKSFLSGRGLVNIFPLFDYINDDFLLTENFDKKNIICYSTKGEVEAKQIMEYLPEYDFVMLKDMTRLDVINKLKDSKVYIDFGNHPGKDRMPRESAVFGNCLITNRRGSANFKEDIQIPDSYKLSEFDLVQISELIRDCIDNYVIRNLDFFDYRNIIKGQKDEFFDQVKKLFIMEKEEISDNFIDKQTIDRWFSSKTVCDSQLSSFVNNNQFTNKNPNYTDICKTLFRCDDVYQNYVIKERRPLMYYPPHIGSSTIRKMVDMLGHLPKLGIEVGSFIGSSAVFLGDFMRISGGVLVCVDTWCGDINMWLLDSFQDTMAKYDGDPKIYELFMQNIIDNKLQGTVIPLRLTSIIAARMLRILNYEIDFVYVDSAHEAGETFMELMLYHDILKDGGVLFGDDYEGFPAVKYDVDLFCKRFGYVLEFTGDGDTWMIKKC